MDDDQGEWVGWLFPLSAALGTGLVIAAFGSVQNPNDWTRIDLIALIGVLTATIVLRAAAAWHSSAAHPREPSLLPADGHNLGPTARVNRIRNSVNRWDLRASNWLASVWSRFWSGFERIHDNIANTLERGLNLFTRRVPIIGVLLAVVGIYLAWRFVWEWANSYVSPSTTDEKNDLLTTVAQIAGGFGVALGVFFTFRSIQVNREGQVTERFTRAIDQIGNETLEVRLGGVYALERISRDSARDHGPVVEVLSAYIRNKAPVNFERQEAWRAWDPDDPNNAQLPAASDQDQDRVAEDVQAALTVIGRRTLKNDRQEPFTLDLASTDLRFARCTNANFARVGFLGSDMEGSYFALTDFTLCPMMFANFRSATFFYSSLREANLDFSVLASANLSSSDLRGASLMGTKFGFATLDDAVLWGNAFPGTRFEFASLERAVLVGGRFFTPNFLGANLLRANLGMTEFEGGALDIANLTEATLFGASMLGVSLRRAILQGANLSSGQFTQCAFDQARLIDADLSEAVFTDSSFAEADLSGAFLAGTVFANIDLGEVVGLTPEQIGIAHLAGTTRLPDYLHQQPNEEAE